MIRVYASFYGTEPDRTGPAVRKKEHETGRELLCRGLQELYGWSDFHPVCGQDGSTGTDLLLGLEENGKPFLKGYPDIHFNISHSGGLVVCALSDRRVGVDVETVKPVRDPLIRRVLHEEEIRTLSGFGDISQKQDRKEEKERSSEFLRLFFRYWTLKESYLKRDGCGLTKEPRELCFSVDPDVWEGPVLCGDPEIVCRQSLITLQNDGQAAEYVLAVCMSADEKECMPDLCWI